MTIKFEVLDLTKHAKLLVCAIIIILSAQKPLKIKIAYATKDIRECNQAIKMTCPLKSWLKIL